MGVKGKRFVAVLRILLVVMGVAVASVVSYPFLCSYARGDTPGIAERRAARMQKLRAERDAARERERARQEQWERDFHAKMNAPRKGSRALLESDTIEDEMLEAALKLQPTLARNRRYSKRIVWILLEAAEEYNINPFLALAFASRESSLRANVRQGSIGEQGLLQVHPRGHARRVCGRGRRDLSSARVNADIGLCYYNHLRELCNSEDHWVLVGAYGTGKCLTPERARNLKCGQRKRAELAKAVGEERANQIWPL
jgi:soluble lytic murein transglycosylase-like protein